MEKMGDDSNYNLYKLYEYIPAPFIILDDTGHVVEANSDCLTRLGCSRTELFKKNIFEIIDISDKDKFSKWFYDGLKNNYFEETDWPFQGKAGDLSYYRINARSFDDHSSGEKRISCILLDVTAQTHSLDSLSYSELKFRGLLESTPDAMVIVDREGKIIYINNQTNRYFGYAPDELLGAPVEILIPKKYQKNHIKLRQGFIKEPYPRQMGAGMELFACRKDGSLFPVEVSLNHQKIADEVFILVAVRDITDRKKVEENLRESQERFSSAFEHASIGMALVSPEGKWLKVNQSVCELVGYTKDELMGMTFQDITHPEDLELDLENVYKMLRGELQTYKIEKRYFHRNGQIVWVLLSVSLVRSIDHQPLYFISQIEDITEWKVTQDALMQSEERFRLAASGASMGIWEWDMQNGKDYISGKFCELLGYEKDELEPKLALITKSIHPDYVKPVENELKKHLKKGEVFSIEFQMKKKNGEYSWFSAVGQAQFDEKGTAVRMIGYLIDICKRKQAEDRFKGLFRSSPDGIVIFDNDKKIIMVNRQAEKLFGYSDHEMIDNAIDLYIPQFIPTFESKSIKQQLPDVGDIILDLYALKKNGQKIPVEIAVSPMFSEEGSLMIATIRDISDRLQSNLERKRILAALNVVTDGIFMFESDSLRHIYVNAGATMQLGYSEDELLHMTPLDFKIEYTEKTFREMLHPLLAGKKSLITTETVHRHKNGNKIQVEIIFQTAILDTPNKIVVAVVRDITERKLAEEALHLSEERFRELYENSTFGIYRTSIEGKIILANPALIKLLGFDSLEELQTRNLETDGYGVNSDYTRSEFTQQIESEGKVTDIESIWLKKDGTKIFVRESAKLIIDKYTGEHFYDGTVEDISEKKQAEKERIARQAAEEANKAKSIFLANMSHEIRTPLNSIIGFSDLLYSSQKDPKAKSQIDSIRTSGKNLLRIINDILDLSKIEAGKLELQPEPVNLQKIVDETDILFREKAKEKGISFFVEIENTMPHILKLDETRVRQILFNLIGNAIKFTDTGNVILSISIEKNRSNKVDLIISVKDTGIGIPTDQIKNIFEPFTQQEGQLEKKYGGTGLGLSITQRLVDMMNGKLLFPAPPATGVHLKLYFQKSRYWKV